MSDVLILGVGGTATDIAEVLATPPYQTHSLLGYLDDNAALHGTMIHGKSVLGPLSVVHQHPEAQLVMALGSPRSFHLRATILETLGLPEDRFLSLIHPNAWVSPSAAVGPGSVILAFSQVSSGAVLEGHNTVLSHCAINHDVVLGRTTMCGSGVTISGNVRVGASCYLGAGSVIRDGIAIAAGTLLGAGAVLVRDVESAGVLAGNPARLLRR